MLEARYPRSGVSRRRMFWMVMDLAGDYTLCGGGVSSLGLQYGIKPTMVYLIAGWYLRMDWVQSCFEYFEYSCRNGLKYPFSSYLW